MARRQPEHQLITLFQSLRPRLLNAGRRLLGSTDDAYDAMQDTFVKLWRSGAEANEGTVVTAMRNSCIDTIRRRRPTDPLNDTLPDLSDNEAADELYADVARVIEGALSERDREILMLRDRDGYDMESIALRTGLTEANVRVILSRARCTVRQIYRQRTSHHKQ